MYRNLANKVLLLVFGLFVMAVILKYFHRSMFSVDLFFTVTTAALVGGIADWFAVTALFKKPLGFPWHTAIIPRHRDRVIIAITQVIEQDLLSVESIKKRLEQVHFVRLFVKWADSESGSRFLRVLLIRHSEALMSRTDAPSVAQYGETLVKKGAGQVSITPYIKKFADWLIESGKDRALLGEVIEELIYILENPNTRKTIYYYLESIKQEKTKSVLEKLVLWFGEQTDSINIVEAAEVLQTELLLMLNELRNPDHPLRNWAHSKLAEFTDELENDLEQRAAIEAWKNEVLEKAELKEPLANLSHEIMKNASLRSDSPFIVYLNDYLARYWDLFRTNSDLQDWLEHRIKEAVHRLIEREHHIIGKAVRQVLEALTNDDLSRFIEDKAGDDLQWIRINGSIVGGLVGLAAFLFLRLIYDPFVVPVVRTWLL